MLVGWRNIYNLFITIGLYGGHEPGLWEVLVASFRGLRLKHRLHTDCRSNDSASRNYSKVTAIFYSYIILLQQ